MAGEDCEKRNERMVGMDGSFHRLFLVELHRGELVVGEVVVHKTQHELSCGAIRSGVSKTETNDDKFALDPRRHSFVGIPRNRVIFFIPVGHSS